MNPIQELCKILIQKFYAHTDEHVFTVAISGIDASGKGFVAKLLENELEKQGLRIANINIDPWQNPIPVRLQKENVAGNFYRHAFRWNDFFSQLIIPLQKNRSIYLETMLIRTYGDKYYPFDYRFKKIDILLIEGIFLFRKEFLSNYDWKVWIDCSFETFLQRAITRNVERLNEQQITHDYNRYYYPAQQYHFKKDDPKAAADFIFDNN